MTRSGSNRWMVEPPVELERVREEIDARLEELASQMEAELPDGLGPAIGYALRSPGKRIRPALLVAAYRAVGGKSPAVIRLATAVEVVHTYSLVHDDLPCMDNDALRRGRPTVHVRFDVVTAIRTGYLLVPVAAEELVASGQALGLDDGAIGTLAATLFSASGIRGMVGGQWCDLEAEGHPLDLAALRRVHRAKTGALIEAAVVLGGLAARASDGQVASLREFGREIGLAFQVADDVLDATRTSAELGKTAGKDAIVAKSTYVSLLGVEQAVIQARTHADRAIESLSLAGLATGGLVPLARYIVNRTS